MKFSIIVPVYNVEKYIKTCLVSCCCQDLPTDEFEVIVVNDGTPDNSMEYVEEIAKQHSNIVVVSQENAGLSAARNRGLSIAKGEYVWFVDSDDWIEFNCLNELYNKCKNDNLDILYIGAIHVTVDSVKKRYFTYELDGDYKGKDCLYFDKIRTCAQYAIYNTEFLNKNQLRFYNGIFHEDFEFTYRAVYYANKVRFTDKICYYHFLSQNSITRSVNPKKSFDLIIVCMSLSSFLEKVDDSCKAFYHKKISTALNNALYNNYSMDKNNKSKLNNLIYSNRFLLKHLLLSKCLKYQVEGFLFKFFPRNTIQVYNLIQLFNRNENSIL